MPSLDILLELFRQSGRKITPQRRAILELLARNDAHPTAEEIYQQVAATMPDVSCATVYNTLRELVALGALTTVPDLSGGRLRYDTQTNLHHHLFCMRCHALADVRRDFDPLYLTPAETAGYQIIGQQVTFYGLCPECQKHTVK
ncbi:MAG TPA: Fur family transcriptional regulator [Anaerolineae bacterium]|nr:Fur family transcriptional regulator [Anaerolineae bacterium]HQH38648.1 Fur family transcriptional regulator [Anaerolineae bacterium]